MTPYMPRKSSHQRQETESRILRAAEHCFAAQGFHGTTMDKLAAVSGMSKQNLIYYFPSKEVLYKRVLQHILDLWLESMSFKESDIVDPAATIATYIRGKFLISQKYPDASKVFAHEVMNGAPVLQTTLQDRLKPLFEKDVKIVQKWIDMGLMQTVSPQHLFFMIWAATQTYADFACQISLMLGKENLEQADYEAATQTLTQMVIQGLGIKQQPKRL